MSLANSLQQAYETRWSYINTFKVIFGFSDFLLKNVGWTNFDNDDIQLNIISIDTPEFTNTQIEVFQADEWRIHNGRDELYRFSVTFRDKNQMELYNKFIQMYKVQRLSYFDEIKSTVTIEKEADWLNEKDRTLLSMRDVLIENVSKVQFSNSTEAQIAEFSVGFKCTRFEFTAPKKENK